MLSFPFPEVKTRADTYGVHTHIHSWVVQNQRPTENATRLSDTAFCLGPSMRYNLGSQSLPRKSPSGLLDLQILELGSTIEGRRWQVTRNATYSTSIHDKALCHGLTPDNEPYTYMSSHVNSDLLIALTYAHCPAAVHAAAVVLCVHTTIVECWCQVVVYLLSRTERMGRCCTE